MPYKEQSDNIGDNFRLPLLEKLKSYKEKVASIQEKLKIEPQEEKKSKGKKKLKTDLNTKYDLSQDSHYLYEMGDLFNTKSKETINDELKEVIEDEMKYADEAIKNIEDQIEAPILPYEKVYKERKEFLADYESVLHTLKTERSTIEIEITEMENTENKINFLEEKKTTDEVKSKNSLISLQRKLNKPMNADIFIAAIERQNGIKLDKDKKKNYKEKFNKYVYLESSNLIEHFNDTLKQYGFVTTSKDLSFGALFPKNDWVELYSADTEQAFDRLGKQSKNLMTKYEILTDENHGLLRSNQNLKRALEGEKKKEETVEEKANKKEIEVEKFDKLKCICISWALIGTRKDNTGKEKQMYAPILGFNNNIKKRNKNPITKVPLHFDNMAVHLGLPRIPKMEEADFKGDTDLENHNKNNPDSQKINAQYLLMMSRSQKQSLNYEIRNTLGLRLPARQSMLSYATLIALDPARLKAEKAAKTENAKKVPETEKIESFGEIDLQLNRWDVFQCAEPAALLTASSLLSQGQDISICFPFEAEFPSATQAPRPKETCEWCATVELAFRNFKLPEYCAPTAPKEFNPETLSKEDVKRKTIEVRNFTERFAKHKMNTLEHLHHSAGNKTDLSAFTSARSNINLIKGAYANANIAKMNKIRALFKEAGLLQEFLIKEHKTKHIYADSMNNAERTQKKNDKGLSR